MPDLDQLLDNLATDVSAATRPPGAQAAITRSRRRRVAVAVAGAGAVVAVAGGVLAGAVGGLDRTAPAVDPATSPSASPTAQDTPEWPASTLTAFGRDLDEIVTQVPGWDVGADPVEDDWDYAFNGKCAGDWAQDATGGSDGGTGVAGIGHAGWPTTARAVHGARAFVGNLESCDKHVWRTQAIGPSGAVLAVSSTAVVWIQQIRGDVWVLQVPTEDGPPPRDVQLDVVEWLEEYNAWQNDEARR